MARTRRPKGDGSIFRLADGRWSARLWIDDPETGRTRRSEVTGRTKTEVSRKLAAMRARIEQGQPARDDTMAFAAYAERWLSATLPASSRKETTQQLYAGLTRNHILPSDLGRLTLDRMRPSDIDRFIIQLRAKGLGDSTVRQIYTIGRAIGDSAVRDGILGRNPFTAVSRPRIRRREATHLEPDQVSRLLEAASGSRYLPLFQLMVNTGLRRGEALGLRWRDVDLERRTLFVRGTLVRIGGELTVTEPKSTHARRHVPLSPDAVDVLLGLRDRIAAERPIAANLWVQTDFVFTTDIGTPCEPRNALRALKSAAKTAGLADVGLHTLRHSAATVMLTNGVPITVVSHILGHSGIEITVDVYGHVAPHVSQEAVQSLSDALRRGSHQQPQVLLERPTDESNDD